MASTHAAEYSGVSPIPHLRAIGQQYVSAEAQHPHLGVKMMNQTIVPIVIAVALTLAGAPAVAVVYCKSPGAPKGCVARPVPPAAGAAAVNPAPRGGVGGPASGAGVMPGAGAGAGGEGDRCVGER